MAKPYPGAFTELQGRRLMVWKACVAEGGAAGVGGRPGAVLSANPLRVAAGEGAVELIDADWTDGTGSPSLQPGDLLG